MTHDSDQLVRPGRQVQVVTDSVADIPPDLARALEIMVVPVYVRFGDQVYRDVDVNRQGFAQRMLESAMPPKTSQPPPHDFLGVYGQVKSGLPIVSLHVSSKLSGTLQSADMARQLLPERDITVLDTLSASMGQGLAVIEAARAALAGWSADMVVRRARAVIDRLRLFISLDTLEWLKRGGRVGRTTAMVGNLLNIKPILTFDDGILAAFDKVRGSGRIIPRLVDICRQRVVDPARVKCVVAHTAFIEQAEKLRAELERVLGLKDILIYEAGPAIMANVGPHGLGIMFFEDTADQPAP